MNEFQEVFDGQPALDKSKVDRENCVIHDVKITGIVSRNKRRYPAEMLAKRKSLYEGMWVNVDHAPQSISSSPRGVQAGATPVRSSTSKIGRLRGVYAKEDGLYAESFKYNPKHEFAETMLWWAENDPEALCFSQLARGPYTEDKDGTVTIDVAEVVSVDIVGTGGTTKGFHESMELTPLQVELMAIGEFVKGFYGDASLDAIKPQLTKTPTKFEGTVAEALAELKDSPDPRVQRLRLDLNDRLVAEAAAVRVSKAKEACAKLPEVLVSEVFIDTLVSADEAKWPALIEDRRKHSPTKGKPTSATAPSGNNVDDFVNSFRSKK